MALSNEVQLNPTIDFIAGTISGVAGLVVGFPFDTVKVRFQNPLVGRHYGSTWDALISIIREEGAGGLFRGIYSPLAASMLMNGLVFASYRFFTKIQLQNVDDVPTLNQILVAGAITGVVCSFLTTPTDLIKIRQQSLIAQSTALGMAAQIVRESGPFGLFRGFSATALRDLSYSVYFATNEGVKRLLTPNPTPQTPAPSTPWLALLLAGGLAGVMAWLATFPFDVVKTRMQGSVPSTFKTAPDASFVRSASVTPLTRTPYSTLRGGSTQTIPPWIVAEMERRALLTDPEPSQALSAETNVFETTWSTILYSYRTEGIGAFYKGLAPTLVRAFPVNAVTFAVFDLVVWIFSLLTVS